MLINYICHTKSKSNLFLYNRYLKNSLSYTYNAKSQIFFLLNKYSFLPYVKNLWVPVGKKPAPGDHKSNDENSFLRLNNLIPLLKHKEFLWFGSFHLKSHTQKMNNFRLFSYLVHKVYTLWDFIILNISLPWLLVPEKQDVQITSISKNQPTSIGHNFFCLSSFDFSFWGSH